MKKSKKHTQFRRGLAGVTLLSIPALGLQLLAPQSAYAVGEQSGRISGVITDKLSGAPLPGARIEIRGANLIGGPRAALTTDDGTYEFISVPPGPYDVTLNFEGAKPLRRRIVVRIGETFPLNIAWTVEEAKEELKVIYEERKMTRPDTTQTGTVLSADQQSRVASGRSYQDITGQVAGVNDATGTGNPNIKGAMNLHNRYLVDGLDITDPVTNTFSSNINFDSIDSIEVLTGGAEAEYNALGGVINLVTNSGTNEWHVDGSAYFNSRSLSAGSQYGSQLYNGLRPFANLRRSPQSGYQANINIGGPILKNKWWFHASFEYDRRESSLNVGPPLGLQHPPRLFTGYYARFKTAFTPNEKHRLSLSVSTDPAFIDNVDQTNSELGVAENHQNQGGAFGIFQWDYFINKNVNTNVQAGVQYQFLDFGPQGKFGSIDNSAYAGTGKFNPINDSYDPNRPYHTNNDDGTSWYQGNGIQLDRRYTFQFDPSVSVRGNGWGKHEAKFGIQTRYVRHTFDFALPGGRTYSDANGGAGETGLCLPDPDPNKSQTAGCFQRTDQADYGQVHTGYSVGFFAQDRWKVASWLRINPGLRIDYGHSTNSLGEVVSNLWGFGPRIGLVFDITQDQKTILTAYYGRSNEVLSLLASAYADYTPTSCTYQWNPGVNNGAFDPKLGCPATQKGDLLNGKNPWQALYASGGSDGYKLQPNTTPPHTDEVTLSFRREVFENSSANIDYTYKRVGNIWDSRELNQIWDPTGIRVVDYADPKHAQQQIFLFSTFENNWRVYQGVDFAFESRPRQEWDFNVIYTISWLYGPGGEQFGQVSGDQKRTQNYNPRLYGLYDGFLPEDTRHQLKIRASYSVKGFTFGTTLNYSTGNPGSKRYFNQNDGSYSLHRSPSGTDPGAKNVNDVTTISEFRYPPVLIVNARISYDVASILTSKVHMTVIADLFNLFNLDSATGLELRDVPTYGNITSRQSPLRAQLGFRFQY